MRAWNNSSFHSRSGGCVCARRGCTFSTSVAQMQLACSPAGIFFCENSERTCVIQCLSRARRIRIHRGVAEIAERKQPQMDTDSNWKPDLTRIPIPSGEEGPGGTERNVETSKRRNQGLGMRGRGLRRGMQAEPGETPGQCPVRSKRTSCCRWRGAYTSCGWAQCVCPPYAGPAQAGNDVPLTTLYTMLQFRAASWSQDDEPACDDPCEEHC